jgi:hypothetical protein
MRPFGCRVAFAAQRPIEFPDARCVEHTQVDIHVFGGAVRLYAGQDALNSSRDFRRVRRIEPIEQVRPVVRGLPVGPGGLGRGPGPRRPLDPSRGGIVRLDDRAGGAGYGVVTFGASTASYLVAKG